MASDTPQQPTISATWDQASDGTFVATVRVSDLASAEQAKGDIARMRDALSAQQPELPALSDDQERAEFELAFPDCDFRRDATGAYAQLRIRCAWIGWKRRAAVLADRESRKVVAWRYMPSPTWGEYVITQDPKVAEVARSMGVEVEELTVGATSKEATR